MFMNEAPIELRPNVPTRKSYFKLWVILLVVVFVILMGLVLVLPGGPQYGADWLIATAVMAGLSFIVASLLVWLWRVCLWLCCWRNLCRALFGVACVVTGLVLLYVGEDWRGRHAWDQFRHAGEARGEHFDVASLAPPPVPDDRNFALSPIMFSTYGQYFDRQGEEIHPYNTNLVNRLVLDYYGGNYQAMTNMAGDWTVAAPTDFTHLQHFYQSLAAKTNLFPVPLVPQSPASDVLLALSRFDATIEELRQASQLPDSRFPLDYSKADPATILLPHLASLKRSAMFLELRAIAELQTGQAGLAIADITLMERLINSIRTEPLLISHMVRIATLQLMLQPVWEGLADHLWSESQLSELETQLAKFDFVSDYQLAVCGDRAMMIKEIFYLRDHPQMYPDLIPFTSTGSLLPSVNIPLVILSKTHLVPSGWYYQNQLHCVRLMEQYLSVANAEAHTFDPTLAGQAEAFLQNEHRHISPFNALECIQLSWIEQFSAPNGFVLPFAHAQSSVDRARVAIALERFRLAQGKYPDSLDVLAPQYLNPVPKDVIGGQPLHYRLTADGQFVLYSVGWNKRDDGGMVALRTGSTTRPDLTQGDWVWRYPQK